MKQSGGGWDAVDGPTHTCSRAFKTRGKLPPQMKIQAEEE